MEIRMYRRVPYIYIIKLLSEVHSNIYNIMYVQGYWLTLANIRTKYSGTFLPSCAKNNMVDAL